MKLEITHPKMPMNSIKIDISYIGYKLNEFLDYIDSVQFINNIESLVYSGYENVSLCNKIMELMQDKNKELQLKYNPEKFI